MISMTWHKKWTNKAPGGQSQIFEAGLEFGIKDESLLNIM